MAGKAVVLSGSVRTPLDAKRANDIACQFVAGQQERRHASVSGGAIRPQQCRRSAPSTRQTHVQQQTQTQAAACGSDTKLVINLLKSRAKSR